MTTSSGWPARSQVPATMSGADIAGGDCVSPHSCTGDFCAPCTSVADAASYGAATAVTPGIARSCVVWVPPAR